MRRTTHTFGFIGSGFWAWIRKTSLICLSLSIYAVVTASTAQAETVIVVGPESDPSSSRVMKGIESHFKRQNAEVNLEIVNTSEESVSQNEIVRKISASKPSLVITLGSRLTSLINDSLPHIPLIFAGVLHPDLSGFSLHEENPDKGITGASLDISLDVQFSYFKRVCPTMQRIGIIHSEETAPLIPHAKVVAKANGLTLLPIQINADGVSAERQVYAALDSLLPLVDGLWTLADSRVFTSASTKMIIKRTLQVRKPLMGFSSTIVESGALFALDYDYKDIGRQAAEIAVRRLNGESPAEIPITSPGVIWFHYNENTAQRLSLEIPEELKLVAKEVYK